MAKWLGHLTRIRELDIEGVLVAKEPLRIGAGKGTKLGSPIDLPLLRVYLPGKGEVPFIPGSSLKGLFRAYFDVVIRSLRGYACAGSGGSTCMSQKVSFHGEIDKLEKIARRLSARMDFNNLAQLLWENLCLSCKVFGSQSYRSKIIFYDSYPVKDVRIGVKTGIAIDRRTGAAMHGALYQVEYVEPGATFNFHVKVLDAPNYVLGLFAQGLFELNAGRLKVGGFKTRGFGWVELRNPRITIIFYGDSGGGVSGNTLTLNAMDSVDEEYKGEFEVVVEQANGITKVTIEGEDTWRLLSGLAELWNSIRDNVVRTHTPRWTQSGII